ncbi:Glycosyltransferase DXD sugar-binding motif [Trinorchestia longiramus]|nr:Glycosyltransferase DXD sugar-binding motif [Trinorchestia longiramus]
MACNLESVLCHSGNISGNHSFAGPSTAPLPPESMELGNYQISKSNSLINLNRGSITSLSLLPQSYQHNSENFIQSNESFVKPSHPNNNNKDEGLPNNFSSHHETPLKIMSVSVSVEKLDDQPPCEDQNTSCVSDTSEDCSYSSKKSRGSFVCNEPNCGKIFRRPDRLQQHIRIHTGARPYVCDVAGCGRSYTRSQHLARHKTVSHSSSTEQKEQTSNARCSKCDKEYSSVYSLRKHMSQFHARRKHSCPECGMLFLKQQHLCTHMQSHSHQPAYRCEFPGCKKAFAIPSKLKRHALVHQAGRYRCNRSVTCSKTFDKYKDLQQHVAVEHPYTCPVCGVQFAHLGRYNRHRVTHEDLRLTYHCTKAGCGRCYYSLRALTCHVRDKHDGEAQRHSCAVCDKTLSSKQKLQQHLRTHSSVYTRRSCVSPGQVRRSRKDKGQSRTDFRRLLSGLLTPDGAPVRRSSLPQLSASDLKQNMDCVHGTRRLLEGSAFARQNLSCAVLNNLKDADGKVCVKSANSNIDDKDALNSVHRSREFHSNEQVNVVIEGKKIGDIFISGEGSPVLEGLTLSYTDGNSVYCYHPPGSQQLNLTLRVVNTAAVRSTFARRSRRAACLAAITVTGIIFVLQAVIQIGEPARHGQEKWKEVEGQDDDVSLLQLRVRNSPLEVKMQNQTQKIAQNQSTSAQELLQMGQHNTQLALPLSIRRETSNVLEKLRTRHPHVEHKANAKRMKQRDNDGVDFKQRLQNENVLKHKKRTLVQSITPNTCTLKVNVDGTVSMPTFYEDVSPNPEEFNVYLIETSSATTFTGRGLCSLESYCSTNPAAVVWFLVTSHNLSLPSVEHLTALQKVHTNLCVAYADFELLLQGTPLLDLYTSEKFRDTKYLIHNLSDLSRLAVVYKSGGFYSDMDIFLMRNVQHLQNFLALENDATQYSSNGVFHFNRHHPMLLRIMQHASTHYDGYKWGSIGPATFTAVMKTPPCQVTILTTAPTAPTAPCISEGLTLGNNVITNSRSVKIIEPDTAASSTSEALSSSTTSSCSLTALPQSTFYPITTRYLKSLFSWSEDGYNDKPLGQIFPVSVGVHLFNKLSQDMVPQEGSLVNKLASAVCPVINQRTHSKL